MDRIKMQDPTKTFEDKFQIQRHKETDLKKDEKMCNTHTVTLRQVEWLD